MILGIPSHERDPNSGTNHSVAPRPTFSSYWEVVDTIPLLIRS